MNIEQASKVLTNYELKAGKPVRNKGGFVYKCGDGAIFVGECTKSEGYYAKERKITDWLKNNSEIWVDSYIPNADGEMLTQVEEQKYYVKEWVIARECNIENYQDVLEAVKLLARIHNILCQFEEIDCCNSLVVGNTVNKRKKELKAIWNYLRTKKKKNDFELSLYKCFGMFEKEAREAKEELTRLEIPSDVRQLRHGNFNYHNIMFNGDAAIASNYDKVANEYCVIDLYEFMRKILEKNDWDLKLAYKLFEAYDSIRTIEGWELQILRVLFKFPEKFWKIANYYYNTNKAWLSEKNVKKFEVLLSQNDKRQRFVETFA